MNEISSSLINPDSNNISITSKNFCNNNSLIDVRILANIASFSQLLNSVKTPNDFNHLIDSTQKHALSLKLKLDENKKNEYLLKSSVHNNNLVTTSCSIQSITPIVSISKNEQITTERSCNLKTKKKCPHCNFTTYMSQHMKSHLEAHERHRGQMYQCDICYTEFSQKANMHRHRTRHSGIKPYRCRYCSKEFFRKDQMQEHSMTHIKTGDDFDCPVANCNQKFNQHQALRQHLDFEHTINSLSQACCKRCAIMFANPRRLLLHYQTKHDEFQICNTSKLYKNKNKLDENIVSMSNTKLNVLKNIFDVSIQENNNLNKLNREDVKKNVYLLKNGKTQKTLKRRADCSIIKTNFSKFAKSESISPLNNMGYKVEELLKTHVSITSFENHDSEKTILLDKKFSSNFTKKTFENQENLLNTTYNATKVATAFINSNESNKNIKNFDTALSQILNVNSLSNSKLIQKENSFNEKIKNTNYLPLSKSPDYQKLMLNSYKNFNKNKSILASTEDCVEKPSVFFQKNNHAFEQHLQLWTNQANCATSITTSSSSLSLQNEEISLTDNLLKKNNYSSNLISNKNVNPFHSEIYLPTASSTSTISSTSETNGEKQILICSTNNDELTNNQKQNVFSNNMNSINLFDIMQNYKKNVSNTSNLKECSLNNVFNKKINNTSCILLNAMATNTNKFLEVLCEPMECLYCGILFKDRTLYLFHKGLHSEINVWRCNLCGKICKDKYTFTMHMISADHS